MCTPSESVWPVQESLTLGRGVQVGVLPLPDERVYWFVMVNSEQPNQLYADDRREVLNRVGDWHHPIPALIATTPEDQVLHNDIVDIDPLPTFVNDRVVLLGDAAHAMPPDLGQGACQAIEDAVVLAAAIGSTDSLEAALHQYDEQRRARVRPMAAGGSRVGTADVEHRPAGAPRSLRRGPVDPAGVLAEGDRAVVRVDPAQAAELKNKHA